MRTTDEQFENFSDADEEWLSDLEFGDADVDTELFEWHEARARELADTGHGRGTPGPSRVPRSRNGSARTAPASYRRWPTDDAPDYDDAPGYEDAEDEDPEPEDELSAVIRTGARPGRPGPGRRPASGPTRTQTLINGGRRSAGQPHSSPSRTMVIGAAAVAALLAVLSVFVFRSSPSWPASVATVQKQIETACQNPNVASEPGQVNFACAKATSQVLWVFSLITSNDNPQFSNQKTGRKGLEPIAPTQGGEVAWSLNLHHPYNPYDPVDSLSVAARAINNIIAGATLTSANGKPTVQPGLESNPANCAKYTGSPAVVTHAGFPSLCAQPVTSGAGQAALVADVFRAWVVGASAVQANDVSVLFQNANNPGDPQVQAILKTLPPAGS